MGAGRSAPGTATVTIQRNTVPSGTYYLLACADDTGLVTESIENNNCRASGTTVRVPGPDLVVSAVSNPPGSVLVGGSFSVTETVLNQGDAGGVASSDRYYLSLNTTYESGDKLLTGTRSVAALGAGASSTGTAPVTVPATTALGTYYLIVCADGGGAVQETNELNNCRASGTTVGVTN